MLNGVDVGEVVCCYGVKGYGLFMYFIDLDGNVVEFKGLLEDWWFC